MAYEPRFLIIFQTESTASQPDTDGRKEFEKYMFISHLYAMRCAFANVSSLGTLVVKVLVALLRYTDIIPADKAYYEAGIAARVRTYACKVQVYSFIPLNSDIEVLAYP